MAKNFIHKTAKAAAVQGDPRKGAKKGAELAGWGGASRVAGAANVRPPAEREY